MLLVYLLLVFAAMDIAHAVIEMCIFVVYSNSSIQSVCFASLALCVCDILLHCRRANICMNK